MKTKNRYGIYVVIVAILIQMCLGSAYVWSVFQTGVANSIFEGDNAKSGLTFSLLLSMLGIGGVIGGKLSVKYSTRVVVIMGGVILSLGFFLASLVTAKISWLLWLTYGVMGGIGMGFTYSTTISLAQRWFPGKKGLITGVLISALGFGGVIFTPLIETFIQFFGGVGVGEPKTFMVLSLIFLAVCTGGGLFMRNPPADLVPQNAENGGSQVKNYTPAQVLKSSKFYLITVTFMLACMGGLMMIGFAKPIAEAKGVAQVATIGVLLISMFNSVGRLFWGYISDKIERTNVIIILLLGTTVLSLFVNLATGYFIFPLIMLIGFFYGGLLSTFPALTADLFGSKNMAINYGFVLFGFGIGAVVSSQIAGYYKNVAGDNINLMFPAFVIAAACAGMGVVLMVILKCIVRREE